MSLKDVGRGGEKTLRLPYQPNKDTSGQRIFDRSFSPRKRLRKREEFRLVWENGRKRHSSFFTVVVFEKENGPSRLGVTVSRKVGGAVVRNRVKRLIREFFRNHPEWVGDRVDLSIIAKRGSAHLSYQDLSKNLISLLRG